MPQTTKNELKLFDKVDENGKPCYEDGKQAENIVKMIFSDLKLSRQLISGKVAKALLIKKNPEVLKGMRTALQSMLDKLEADEDEHLRACDNQPDEVLNQKSVVIGNILSIYAFTEPNEGDELRVPVKVGDKWENVTYRVNRLKLTPDPLSDPYYAYGLSPVERNSKADSKLLFMGTYPIPTANGSRITKWVDLTPGQSVGEPLYKMGKKTLQHWINTENARNGEKVTAYGQSLGGSLSIIAHIEQPDKVRAEAYCPPALLPHLSWRYKKRLKGKAAPKDGINIYTQKNDFVFKIGMWLPKNSNIYRITPNKNSPSNKLFNHLKCYLATNPDKIEKLKYNEIVGKFIPVAYTIIWQTITIPMFIWNVIYMGLKSVVYPINYLMKTLTRDPEITDKAQKLGHKILAIIYDVLSRIVSLPFVVADFAITLAISAFATICFSIFSGINALGLSARNGLAKCRKHQPALGKLAPEKSSRRESTDNVEEKEEELPSPRR